MKPLVKRYTNSDAVVRDRRIEELESANKGLIDSLQAYNNLIKEYQDHVKDLYKALGKAGKLIDIPKTLREINR